MNKRERARCTVKMLQGDVEWCLQKLGIELLLALESDNYDDSMPLNTTDNQQLAGRIQAAEEALRAEDWPIELDRLSRLRQIAEEKANE